MPDVYSNGPNKDFVVQVFSDLIRSSDSALLAAPYFTEVRPIIEAARNNAKIHLLIGLNGATKPEAVQAAMAETNIDIRYLSIAFMPKSISSKTRSSSAPPTLPTAGSYPTAKRSCVYETPKMQ